MANKVAKNKNLVGRRQGRPKGSPNKTTALLKDAILMAAEKAGDKKGMVGYLVTQAKDNPTAFMGLLGKVLPMQVEGTGPDGAITVTGLRISFVGDDKPDG